MDSYPKVGMRKVDNFLTNYDVTKDNTWGGGRFQSLGHQLGFLLTDQSLLGERKQIGLYRYCYMTSE